MKSMDLVKYENQFPEKRFKELADNIFSDQDWRKGLKLIISIENNKVNLKEIGDLFHFIYRVDGKLYHRGIYSYSHSRNIQITTSFRSGSLEIIIDTLSNNVEYKSLIILWLCLKYLPSLVSSFSGSLLNFTESLKNYREYEIKTIEVRRLRKEIRQQINTDSELELLNKKDKEKIIRLLQEIYSDNKKNLPGTVRLLRSKLKHITMKIINDSDDKA